MSFRGCRRPPGSRQGINTESVPGGRWLRWGHPVGGKRGARTWKGVAGRLPAAQLGPPEPPSLQHGSGTLSGAHGAPGAQAAPSSLRSRTRSSDSGPASDADSSPSSRPLPGPPGARLTSCPLPLAPCSATGSRACGAEPPAGARGRPRPRRAAAAATVVQTPGATGTRGLRAGAGKVPAPGRAGRGAELGLRLGLGLRLVVRPPAACPFARPPAATGRPAPPARPPAPRPAPRPLPPRSCSPGPALAAAATSLFAACRSLARSRPLCCPLSELVAPSRPARQLPLSCAAACPPFSFFSFGIFPSLARALSPFVSLNASSAISLFVPSVRPPQYLCSFLPGLVHSFLSTFPPLLPLSLPLPCSLLCSFIFPFSFLPLFSPPLPAGFDSVFPGPPPAHLPGRIPGALQPPCILPGRAPPHFASPSCDCQAKTLLEV
ncbi:uncharacterized protein WM277_020266 [Molossus nigricans]